MQFLVVLLPEEFVGVLVIFNDFSTCVLLYNAHSKDMFFYTHIQTISVTESYLSDSSTTPNHT